MGIFEDAVIYATEKHNGKVRKTTGIPAILHSMEVANIISTITKKPEVMVAGLLHDVVEDTDGTLEEIREMFGERVAELVEFETENKYEGEDKASSWKKRKEETIKKLKSSNDRDGEILWLADKLSNIRSLASSYSEYGENIWDMFNQKDPGMHLWYYKTVAEILEMHLNRTGAFKEYIKHINYIWPGTFSNDKSRYIKYKEVSLNGCKLIGKGAKSEVYRYDDELVLKLYNEDNEYKDIEREHTLSRYAFVAGIPTAIPFGIVKVANQYGAMFELLEAKSISSLIALNPDNVKMYAVAMADLAKLIHKTKYDEKIGILPNYMNEVYAWIEEGVANEDRKLAEDLKKMVDALPKTNTLIHGDFHAGNVMFHNGEYILIDMNRLSVCHPIVELSGLYMFYIGFWELDKPIAEDYIEFSKDIRKELFYYFMESYMGTKDIQEIVNKAALLCYTRLVRRSYKKDINLSQEKIQAKDYYMSKIRELVKIVDNLDFEVSV